MSPRARIMRFGVSGSIAAVGQFLVLALLLRAGWNRIPANLAGMIVGAQISFVLGYLLTWRDRDDPSSLARRWLMFHGSIAGTAVLNLAIFAVCQSFMPAMLASALGILVASIGNFVAGDRLVFRSSPAAC